MKQTSSKHEANVLNIHVHDLCSKFASSLFHHVNTPLVGGAFKLEHRSDELRCVNKLPRVVT